MGEIKVQCFSTVYLVCGVALLLVFSLLKPSLAGKNQCLIKNNISPASLVSTKDLQENEDGYLFVDTRSRLEYEVIHVKDALHRPVVTLQKEDIEKAVLEADKQNKTVVLYCNGGL